MRNVFRQRQSLHSLAKTWNESVTFIFELMAIKIEVSVSCAHAFFMKHEPNLVLDIIVLSRQKHEWNRTN